MLNTIKHQTVPQHVPHNTPTGYRHHTNKATASGKIQVTLICYGYTTHHTY